MVTTLMVIDIDQKDVLNATTDKDGAYVVLGVTTSDNGMTGIYSATAELEPRYAQTSMVSAS
jgi:hypothetical protein